MKQFALVVLILSVFTSCNTSSNSKEKNNASTIQQDTLKKEAENQKKTDKQTVSSQDSFFNTVSIFAENLKTSGGKEFINKNNGVYIISSNGAIPNIEKQFDLNPEILSKTLSSKVKFEVLPKVVCADYIYDKQGSFAEENNSLFDSKIWIYCDLSEEEKQAIEELAKTISYTVIDTESYIYYFSIFDNKWTLSFIDVRIPCQG